MSEINKKALQKALSAIVKKKRTELGISQENLALQSNLHRSYVYNIEKGDCNISLESIFSLAKALQCHVKELISKLQKKKISTIIKDKNIPESNIEVILLTFGQSLKEKRLLLNISQDELSSNSGLHRTYVSQVENGKRNISLENLFVLAQALRCEASDLIPDLRIQFKKAKKESLEISNQEKSELRRGFGTTVKAKRHVLGISQEELAARSGLHRGCINKVEKGAQNISLDNIYMLAKALECNTVDLIPCIKNTTPREESEKTFAKTRGTNKK
jgi:transcriptional regulator with XRE-family HTH domain